MSVYEKYPELQLYNSIDNAITILEKQFLLARHHKDFSDKEKGEDANELALFDGTLTDYLIPHCESVLRNQCQDDINLKDFIQSKYKGGVKEVAEDAVLKFVNTLKNMTEKGVAIRSFYCSQSEEVKENGSSYMFKEYGDICLVFDTKKLVELMKKEGEIHTYGAGILTDVIYEDEAAKIECEFGKNKEVIRCYLAKMLDCLHKGIKYEADDISRDTPQRFIESVIRLKGTKYKNESEVRLAMLPIVGKDFKKMASRSKNITKNSFRVRGKNRYLNLFHKLGDLPIQRVIIRESEESENQIDNLRLILNRKNIPFSFAGRGL